MRGRSSRPPYCLQLLLDDVEVGDRVAVGLQRRGVQHVHQHRAALDMAQELQAQALALAGAGDQPGHVRDGVDGRTGGHHAEVGHQRGERVVGDLRLGGATAPRSARTCRRSGSRRAPRRRRSSAPGRCPGRRRARRAARSRAPCGGPRPAPRCRGRRGRPGRRRRWCPGRPGRRARCPALSSTTVPSGTGRTRSWPSLPERLPPSPGLPLVALRCGLWW